MSKHPGFNPRNAGMPNGAKPMPVPTGQPAKPGAMTVNDVFDGAQALLEGGKIFGQALSNPPAQPEPKKEPTIAAVVPVDTAPASEPNTPEKIVSKSAEVISTPKEPVTPAPPLVNGFVDPRNIGETYRNHSIAEMPHRWYIGCFDGENDAIIPTGIKFNTSRIKVGDICDLTIWSPESQVGFRQAIVTAVDENNIVFKAFNCVTMRDEDITISAEMLMNPGKRRISIAGQRFGTIPGSGSVPYPYPPQYRYGGSPPIPAL